MVHSSVDLRIGLPIVLGESITSFPHPGLPIVFHPEPCVGKPLSMVCWERCSISPYRHPLTGYNPLLKVAKPVPAASLIGVRHVSFYVYFNHSPRSVNPAKAKPTGSAALCFGTRWMHLPQLSFAYINDS